MIRLTSKLTTNPINQCGLIAGALGGESIVLLVLVNTLLLKAFSQGGFTLSDPKGTGLEHHLPFSDYRYL